MTGVFEDMDGIAPIDVAERWYARLMSPDCSSREKEQFHVWLRSSPENALAFEETEALWASLGGLDEDEVVGPHALEATKTDAAPFMEEWTRAAVLTPPKLQLRRRRVRRWPFALAAGLAVVACALTLPGRFMREPAVTFSTLDHVQSIQLEDGSAAKLDLDTGIDVRLSRSRRDIELLRGRVVFDVAHDASRPFVVDGGAGRVTALGTRFEVERVGEMLAVTLLEGSVSIDSADMAGQARSLRLIPGQRATYAPSTLSWSVAAVDATALTSWSEGFHVFDAKPLSEAVDEINRYSRTKLELADPALATLRLSGSYRLGDARVAAQALPYALPVATEARGNVIVIREK